MPQAFSLDRLSDTEFEEFSFDLLTELKFVNVDWRKGTGKKTSPADRGRDIVCQEIREDIDGSVHLETWFIDCKHFKRGVPPTELQNLLAWAQAERPHTALFIVSNFLSNPSKDYLDDYCRNQKPPFKIKVWERTHIHRLARRRIRLLRKYDLTKEPIRSVKSILAAETEFFEKIWYDRHMLSMQRLRAGGSKTPRQIMQQARAAAQRIQKKYGKGNVGPWTEFEWGMLSGKLSALRWVLGSEWDMLDT